MERHNPTIDRPKNRLIKKLFVKGYVLRPDPKMSRFSTQW